MLFAALCLLEVITIVTLMAPYFAPDTEFDSAVLDHFTFAAIAAPVIPADVTEATNHTVAPHDRRRRVSTWSDW
ncbi:MAG: hypothetical protein NVS3B5_12940 [Sphingomicrobium sp.]